MTTDATQHNEQTAADSPPASSPLALVGENIRRLQPYQPGRPISEVARERGITDIIKLASNENPLGAGKLATAAAQGITSEMLARYPDANGAALRDAISRHSGMPAENIILGNGSNEILELAAHLTLQKGAAAVFSQHAFIVYTLATASRHADAIVVPAAAGYTHDLPAMARAAQSDRARLMFIANPNNPTGTYHTPDDIYAALKNTPPHVLVVLDEAYYEYTDAGKETQKFIDEFPNLLITRTFSKIHGIAGARAGYGFAAAPVIEMLNRIRQPFNMNIVAQLTAAAALDDTPHIAASIKMNRDGIKTLAAAFDEMGVEYIPTHANFLTFRPPEDMGGADRVYDAMLQSGVIIRKLKEYDMPQWLRLTVGAPEQNERFLQTLAGCR